MPENTITRKLTAILYADVVGYSRLTGSDELGTHHAVMDVLEHTRPSKRRAARCCVMLAMPSLRSFPVSSPA